MNIEEKPIIGRPKFHYQTNKLKKSEAGTTEKKKLIIASVISLIFMILEIVGGIISGSLSIITDAFHILSDVSSFLISLIAIWLTKKQSTDTMSFGYRRAEALGSLFSIFLIWGLTIWFIVEAIHRFMTPEPIEPLLMIIVAFVGLLFNIIQMKVLHHGHGHADDHGHNHGEQKNNHDSHKHENGHVHDHDSHKHDHQSHKHDHDSHQHDNSPNEPHSHQHVHGDECNHAQELGVIQVAEGAIKTQKHKHTEICQSQNNQVPAVQDCQQGEVRKNSDEEQPRMESMVHQVIEIKNRKNIKIKLEPITQPPIIKPENYVFDTSCGFCIQGKDCQVHLKKPSNVLEGEQKQKSGRSHQKYEHENLNMRAAFIHVLGDALQSVGVCIAALLIYFGGPKFDIADPICTLIFAILVLFTTIPIFKDSISILMEAAPSKKHVEEFYAELSEIESVISIHDIHLWQISQNNLYFSAHITSEEPSRALKEVTTLCQKYNIHHSTLQAENVNEDAIYDSKKCSQFH